MWDRIRGHDKCLNADRVLAQESSLASSSPNVTSCTECREIESRCKSVRCLFNQQDHLTGAERETELRNSPYCAQQSRLDWIVDLGYKSMKDKIEKTQKTERHIPRRTNRRYRQCCRYITLANQSGFEQN
jgi:hypothetical protein